MKFEGHQNRRCNGRSEKKATNKGIREQRRPHLQFSCSIFVLFLLSSAHLRYASTTLIWHLFIALLTRRVVVCCCLSYHVVMCVRVCVLRTSTPLVFLIHPTTLHGCYSQFVAIRQSHFHRMNVNMNMIEHFARCIGQKCYSSSVMQLLCNFIGQKLFFEVLWGTSKIWKGLRLQPL